MAVPEVFVRAKGEGEETKEANDEGFTLADADTISNLTQANIRRARELLRAKIIRCPLCRWSERILL